MPLKPEKHAIGTGVLVARGCQAAFFQIFPAFFQYIKLNKTMYQLRKQLSFFALLFETIGCPAAAGTAGWLQGQVAVEVWVATQR